MAADNRLQNSIFRTFVLSLQHCIAMSSTLVLPAIMIMAIGGHVHQALVMTQATMFAIGVGTIVMSIKIKRFSPGYLTPLVLEPSIFSAAMLAVRAGGLPLVFGLGMVAGLFQLFFAGFLPFLKRLFPVEVTGVVILMIGITLITPGIEQSFGLNMLSHDPRHQYGFLVGFVSLATMVAITIWGGKRFSLYALITGTVIGSAIAFAWHGNAALNIHKVEQYPWFTYPKLLALNQFSFDPVYFLPFLVAALSSCLKGVGNLTTYQKAKTQHWSGADFKKIRQGVFINGLGSLLSSAIGGLPLATSSSNVGLAIATRSLHRIIALLAGLLFLILSFIPKLSVWFVIIPLPVKGAILVYVTVYVILAGLQISLSRSMDARKIFTVTLPIIFGLGVKFVPGATNHLSLNMKHILSSPLTTATLFAIIFSLIFRFGSKKTAKISLKDAHAYTQKLSKLFQEKAHDWQVSGIACHNLQCAIYEAIELADSLKLTGTNISIRFGITEHNLEANIIYKGQKPNSMVNDVVSCADIIEHPALVRELSMKLIHSYVDAVKISQQENNITINLSVEQ